MTYLLLHTFLLMLAAYFLGAFFGCTAKRMIKGSRELEPAFAGVPAALEAPAPRTIPVTMPPPLAPLPPPVMPPPAPLVARHAEHTMPQAMPRAPAHIQPMVETGRRPDPRLTHAIIDPSRFERALFGPDPNEGMPRRAVVEIMPAVFGFATGPALPWPPPKPEPIPEPEPEAEPEPVLEAEPESELEHEPELEHELESERLEARSPELEPVPEDDASPEDQPLPADQRPAEQADATRNDETRVEETPTAAKPKASIGSVFSGAAQAAARTAAAAAAAMAAARGMIPKKAPASEATEDAAARASDETAPRVHRTEERVITQPVRTTGQRHKFDTSGGDDLQRIRAIDAETERRLKEIGVAMFDTVASWTPGDVNRVNQALGFTDRIDREQWIEQAQILAKGGETYYSRNRAATMKAAAAEARAIAASEPGRPASEKPISVLPPPALAYERPHTAERPKSQDEPAPEPQDVAQEPQDSSPVTRPVVTQPAAPSVITEGRSVADMAAAAAAAIAAASASVTRGMKPIEPISPLSKLDRNIAIPARLKDALAEKQAAASQAPEEIGDDELLAGMEDVPYDADADDLKRIRGIGVLIEKRLVAMGISRYEHIANWSAADIDRVSQVLDFKGRIEREGWVEQARILASGANTEFSRRVDRGDVDTSR